VDPFVVGLVALSAVLHVAWNVLIKTAGDPLRAATVGMVAAAFGIVPLGLVAWWLTGAASLPVDGVVLGVASGLLETAYFVFLAAAYRRGDLSVVYSIARGTAPLLAVALGIGLFGERLGTAGWIGVALLLLGFVLLQRPWAVFAGRTALDPAIRFALATGATIAAYSAVDRAGTRIIDPIPYAAILWLTASFGLLLWTRIAGRGGLRFRNDAETRRAAVGGWLTLAGYLLILFALSVAPLSGVAPLRESGTVLAAAWGSIRLHEAVTTGESVRRIGASAAIVAGAVLLAIG
jgi:uncharacterized membrane protein